MESNGGLREDMTSPRSPTGCRMSFIVHHPDFKKA
jgi:hypothetical protein